MAKLRHIAFICEDPIKMADYLQKAFDLELLYQTGPDVAVLSDGTINFTLLPRRFAEHDPVDWHFGFEMTQDEIAARRSVFEELGTPVHDGVHDGRPVEAYVHTPEGQRIDVAPFWPTKKGESRRQQEYRVWEQEPVTAGEGGRGA